LQYFQNSVARTQDLFTGLSQRRQIIWR